MLNEINKTHKDKHHIISLVYKFQKVGLIEVESKMMVTKDWDEYGNSDGKSWSKGITIVI